MLQIFKFYQKVDLPLFMVQTVDGCGAPTALHTIVASLPSSTVTFFGDCSMIGVDANIDAHMKMKQQAINSINFRMFQ